MPTFIGGSSVTTNGGTSLSVSPPTGAQAGDFAVVSISHRGGTNGTITAPGGWTQIGSQLNSGTTLADAAFYKLLESGDIGTGHQFGLAASNVKGVAVMHVIRATPGRAFYAGSLLTSAGQVNGSTANIAVPGLTTADLDMFLLATASKADGATHDAVSEWTLSNSATNSSGGGGMSTRNRTSIQHRAFANPPDVRASGSGPASGAGLASGAP